MWVLYALGQGRITVKQALGYYAKATAIVIVLYAMIELGIYFNE